MLMAAMGAAFVSGLPARGADNPTALQLIKEGDRYVGEQCKDKVVRIRSERSVGSVVPNIWYVEYYDPTATLKATEVKFGAGKMMEVKRPLHLLEPVTGGESPLELEKLKIDSDQALNTALKEPLLENIKVTATRLRLERVGEGVLGRSAPSEAVWKVTLWAAKMRDGNRSVDIGDIWVSATDAKVLKIDLHPGRLS